MPRARPSWRSVLEKSWHPCWERTRADALGPAGPVERRCLGSDKQVVPRVWRGPSQDVLQADQVTCTGDPELAEAIKEMIEAELSFGYRTVGALLGMNKSTCSGTSSSKVGRRASAPSASDRGSKRRCRGPKSRASAGRLTCVAYGVAGTMCAPASHRESDPCPAGDC